MFRLLASPWVYWVARAILILVALDALLLTLQIVGATVIAPRLVRLDPIAPQAPFVRVTGQTLPSAVVEVGTNQRTDSVTVAGFTGRFEARIEVPRGSTHVRARARWFTTGRVLGMAEVRLAEGVSAVERPPSPASAPTLSIAYYVQDLGRLWIAGQATSTRSPVVVERESGERVAEIESDETALFDALVEVGSPAPTRVRASSGRAGATPSDFITVIPVSLAELPLSRELTIDVRPDRTTVRWAISLPAAHPFFRGLLLGRLPMERFVESTCGRSNLPLLLITPAFSITEATGVVTFEQRLAGPMADFGLVPGRSGIAAAPLLSGRDGVVISHREMGALAVQEPLPTELAPGRAVWRGPLHGDVDGPLISARLGGSLFDLVERLRRARSPQASERLQAYISEFERRAAGDVVERTWRFLLGLVPFAGLVWLWRRHPFGDPAVWPTLAAVTLLVTVWRSWSYLQFAASGLTQWIFAASFPLLAQPSPSAIEALRDVAPSAAWLVFALVLPVATSRFGAVATVATPPAAPPAAWSVPPGRVARLRLAYAGLVLIGLIVIGSHPMPMQMVFQGLFERLGGWAGIGPLLVTTFLLLTLGLRAGLFGLALLLLSVHALATGRVPVPDVGRAFIEMLDELPAWPLLTAVAATAYLVLLRLVRSLTLADPARGRRITALATVVALLLPHLPADVALLGAGIVVLVSAVLIVIRGLGHLAPVTTLAAWSRDHRWLFLPSVIAVALVMAWPVARPESELRFPQLARLVWAIGEMLIYVPAVGVVLLLLQEARRAPAAVVGPAAVQAGVYLFAVFLINSSATWLFLPLPLLVGWLLARYWLFRAREDVGGLAPAAAAGEGRARLIRAFFDATAAGDQRDTADRTLAKQLEAGQITPEQYEERRTAYHRYFAGRLADGDGRTIAALREAVFSVGGGSAADNVTGALGCGAVLAAIPFLIAVYQYVPTAQVQYPYPVAELVTFLIRAAAAWLLYAFFFGYFFTHLRGHTGLAKGVHLFLALTVPLAVWRLLVAQSLTDLRPFLLWASQVFLFCSILGLAAFDYRAVRPYGRGVRDLTAVHNIPALSLYGSSLVAALVPALIALFTGRVKDLVAFFLNEVLPRVPPAPP
jgi:hypothetical protein